MSFFDTKIWLKIKKNEKLYGIIHRTIGQRIRNYRIRGRVNEMRTKGLESISETDVALAETGCVFFVDFGTLLGFVRDGKPLSWDYDIDFGICFFDSFVWTDLKRTMEKIGFQLVKQFSYKELVTEQTYRKGNIYIDFFAHFSDTESSYYYVYYKQQGYKYENKQQLHVRMTRTVKITGNMVYSGKDEIIHVPIEYKEYLSDVFGKDWKIPNPSWEPRLTSRITKMGGFGLLSEFDYIEIG